MGNFTFPLGSHQPIAHPGPPPAAADVVVIGGGVVGVSTALFLARKGLSVVLVEKGRVAAEQSSRNWGWIRQQGRDAAELPIMIEARRHWQAFATETNEDFGLTQAGVTYLARSDRDMAGFEAWLKIARAHDLDTRLLDGDETAALIPGMSRRFAGALHTASDMKAEPWLAVPALARLATRAGAKIIENCAARALDIEAGRVTGVMTEAGRIATHEVVLAGGAWSSLFLRRHGTAIPQLSVRATVVATQVLPLVHEGGATDERIAFRRRQDGGYTLATGALHHFAVGPDAFRHVRSYLPVLSTHLSGTRFRLAAPANYPDAWGTARHWSADETSPFERMRVLNPAPAAELVDRLTDGFGGLFPSLGKVGVRTAWAGMIDTMPDVVPVIDRASKIAGLTIGTGMCGHGFGIGPGVGRVLADLATGGAVGHDLTRFRLSRFSDGSPIEVGPAL